MEKPENRRSGKPPALVSQIGQGRPTASSRAAGLPARTSPTCRAAEIGFAGTANSAMTSGSAVPVKGERWHLTQTSATTLPNQIETLVFPSLLPIPDFRQPPRDYARLITRGWGTGWERTGEPAWKRSASPPRRKSTGRSPRSCTGSAATSISTSSRRRRGNGCSSSRGTAASARKGSARPPAAAGRRSRSARPGSAPTAIVPTSPTASTRSPRSGARRPPSPPTARP